MGARLFAHDKPFFSAHCIAHSHEFQERAAVLNLSLAIAAHDAAQAGA